jgi:tetratricopeptide (TPR) repeat protein
MQAGFWRTAGLAELRFGNLDRAVQDFHRASSLYFERGDLVAAQEAAEQILSINDRDAKAHLICGECNVERGFHEKALEHLRVVLESQPGHPQAARLVDIIEYQQASQAKQDSHAPLGVLLKALTQVAHLMLRQ